MGAFDGIDIARTGAGFTKYWLDTIAHNIANVNTVTRVGEEPFQARMVIAQELGDEIAPTGSGVVVGGVEKDDTQAPIVQDPDHPLADEFGYVQGANVDLGGEMADMIIAQRSYVANIRAIQSAQEAYEAALRIGQG